jgi:hypothetical protein
MVAIFAEDCGCAHQYLDLYVFLNAAPQVRFWGIAVIGGCWRLAGNFGIGSKFHGQTVL